MTTRRTTDSIPSIDIRQLKRWGQLIPNTAQKVDVGTATIAPIIAEKFIVPHLYYRHPGEKQSELIQFRIDLTKTPCHLGGERTWFVCPRCKRRAAILYLYRRTLDCRRCQDLVYQTQRQDPAFRALTALRKRHQRLSDWGLIDDPNPEKPKYMHWSTYLRLMNDDLKAAEVCDQLARDRWGDHAERLLDCINR
jgi:hypothetical protein